MANIIPSVSFEFFPPRDNQFDCWIDKIKQLCSFNPSFISITWKNNNHKLTLKSCKKLTNSINTKIVMHLTCSGINETDVDNILYKCSKNKINNILALKGDETNHYNFEYAKDLIKYIKLNFKNQYSIYVSGYPECYKIGESMKENISYLKQKVNEGAEYIITQFFYDVNYFYEFEKMCRENNITQKIIAGIFPIQNYKNYLFVKSLGNVTIPNELENHIETHKNDDDSILDFSIDFITKMCNDLIAQKVSGIHFYTMNNTLGIIKILNQVNLIF